MTSTVWLRRATLAIGLITLVSGLVQMLAPRLVLERLASSPSAAALHSFGIVGMFMVLFGGLVLHAVRRGGAQQDLPLVWAAIQKFGASGAVGLGVMNAVFAPVALLVAGFDLLSGFVILALWRAERRLV